MFLYSSPEFVIVVPSRNRMFAACGARFTLHTTASAAEGILYNRFQLIIHSAPGCIVGDSACYSEYSASACIVKSLQGYMY